MVSCPVIGIGPHHHNFSTIRILSFPTFTQYMRTIHIYILGSKSRIMHAAKTFTMEILK